MTRRLYRVDNGMIAGVCGGVAEYFNIDPTVIRLLVVALFFAGTLSLWVYIIAALIIPKESSLH